MVIDTAALILSTSIEVDRSSISCHQAFGYQASQVCLAKASYGSITLSYLSEMVCSTLSWFHVAWVRLPTVL